MFRGIGFDLDGTLYPNYRLYLRLIPSLIRHPRFLAAFNKVRSMLHQPGSPPPEGDFYENQALLMGRLLKKDPRWAAEKMETLIYRRWEGLFSRVRLFPYVKETLEAFRGAGLRLGVLSDFPPERKLELLGLRRFFDTVLSTEKTGFLKPRSEPFRQFSAALGVPPEEMLYVGNSPRYDAAGALAAGMKAALIKRSLLSTGSFNDPGVKQDCFIFSGYRQLLEYVLG